ncbi:hypothetical protein Tco_0793244 [Tanacetum coccineum]
MRQRRWLELLSDYDCDIVYSPGESKSRADALKQKEREPPYTQSERYHSTSRYARALCNRLVERVGLKPYANIGSHSNNSYMQHQAQPSSTFCRSGRSPVCWTEVGEAQILGPRIKFQETTEKNHSQIKQKCKPLVNDRNLRYLNVNNEFHSGIKVMLKISHKKGRTFWQTGEVEPEFTWEREDQFKKKYPHLFTKTAPSSSAASHRSWSIPSEDPYKEAAQQLLEQVPRSPEYVPENHIPVYIPEPEHPEDLVPAEDEAPIPPLSPSFLALPKRNGGLEQNAVILKQNAVMNEILPEYLFIKTQYGLQAKRNGGLKQNAVILKQNAVIA